MKRLNRAPAAKNKFPKKMTTPKGHLFKGLQFCLKVKKVFMKNTNLKIKAILSIIKKNIIHLFLAL